MDRPEVYLELAKYLCCGDGAYRPIRSRSCDDSDVESQNEDIGINEVSRFAHIECSPERRCRIRFILFLRTSVEANRLSSFCSNFGSTDLAFIDTIRIAYRNLSRWTRLHSCHR